MKGEFESVRMKALKLAALAARGVGGEAANAARMLDELLSKHGMSLDALLKQTERRERDLEVRVWQKWWKPKKDMEMCRLAVQCLRFVCGTNDMRGQVSAREIEIPCRGMKIKMAKIFVLTAEVTDDEFEDWRDCFLHYAPHFAATMEELRAAQRRAALALKRGLIAFVSAHDIFPPDSQKSTRELSAHEMQALIMATRSVGGSQWQRPAGKLEQEGFYLE